MFKNLLFLFIGLICNPTYNPHLNSEKPSIDSIFINWNRATLQSLERQKNLVTDTTRRASYANRIWGFTAYLDIKSLDSVNRMSLRYLFLKELLPSLKGKAFYVVEANSMGAQFIIRDFVIYKNDLGKIEVKLYTYSDKVWYEKGTIQLSTFKLSNDLKRYAVKNGKGFNYEDVIITYFKGKDYSSIDSEFYLDGTLSMDSGIKQIVNDFDEAQF